ncbi:hypothetical protein FGB62_81g04 [Gracilaria domingensis]|nr:hypothetical protein FGB62_81g04 [Gracilaria domingensis]
MSDESDGELSVGTGDTLGCASTMTGARRAGARARARARARSAGADARCGGAACTKELAGRGATKVVGCIALRGSEAATADDDRNGSRETRATTGRPGPRRWRGVEACRARSQRNPLLRRCVAGYTRHRMARAWAPRPARGRRLARARARRASRAVRCAESAAAARAARLPARRGAATDGTRAASARAARARARADHGDALIRRARGETKHTVRPTWVRRRHFGARRAMKRGARRATLVRARGLPSRRVIWRVAPLPRRRRCAAAPTAAHGAQRVFAVGAPRRRARAGRGERAGRARERAAPRHGARRARALSSAGEVGRPVPGAPHGAPSG